MRKNAFKAEDHISALNTFKINKKGESFTKAELKVTLKNSGIPSNDVFINELRKYPVLTQVGKNKFKFVHSFPVYKGVLSKVYELYHDKVKTYQTRYKSKQAVAI